MGSVGAPQRHWLPPRASQQCQNVYPFHYVWSAAPLNNLYIDVILGKISDLILAIQTSALITPLFHRTLPNIEKKHSGVTGVDKWPIQREKIVDPMMITLKSGPLSFLINKNCFCSFVQFSLDGRLKYFRYWLQTSSNFKQGSWLSLAAESQTYQFIL